MAMTALDEVTRDLIGSFVAEGYGLIEDAEAKVGQMGSPGNTEVVNTIFRLFHSIKSTAGYLNFGNIARVTHQAETLLDQFRSGQVKPSQEEIDLVYRTIDFLLQLIVSVDKNLTDRGHEDDTELVVRSLDTCIANIRTRSKAAVTEDDFTSLITPEMRENAFAEMFELLDASEKNMLQFETRPDDKEILNEIFRRIHTIKGTAGFLGFADIEQRSAELEMVLEEFRAGRRKIDGHRISQMLQVQDALRLAVVKAAGKVPAALPARTAPREALAADRQPGDGEPAEFSAAGDAPGPGGDPRPLGEILVQMGAVKPEAVETALARQQTTEFRGDGIPGDGTRKDIRVDMAKLDRLFDMVGELVTAESLVVNNPDLQGLVLHDFDKAAAMLNKICREIQEITMMIRMIPLEGLFTRMSRLVRDLSRKTGKPVNLQISGAETEMDRNVTEQVSDPLVHILRNALDHGIEERAVRLAQGKEAAGTIHLEARYEGNEVWISVRDDGAGLDRGRILAKARAQGLVDGDADKLDDHQVWQIVFEPGFSTATEVTDISGRGVGMDVVRRNIEKLRGRIDIDSLPGRGTQITLRIPLTMAILEAITVRVGCNQYSVPSTEIVELLKAKPQQLTCTSGQDEVLNLRGEILPVIKLADVFHVEDAVREITAGLVVVIQGGGRKACVLVDAIIGSQQVVIKGLSDYIGSVEGIAGCSITGEGGVSFLLDTARLISRCIEKQ